ncbi:thioredoxin [Lachnotalea glycerini]|uniref:Thioredoxin n=1 Tax=Lachnotalea glycerini TaxID=1763509 RepID=A0A255IA55_9FIRM|nr:thioredoxin [Lachnotalea glycerini]PXV85306.1 thioredoxin [Lachnotalea glycerini]RDY29874.1 thioredoxin [Lachnotalea glycerini]
MAIVINDNNFDEEVLKSNLPVLVDFYAEWCGPCKMMGPVVEAIANEVEGLAKVGKIDVDESRVIASKYNVMSVPTFMIFKNGSLEETVVGAVSKDVLKNKLVM